MKKIMFAILAIATIALTGCEKEKNSDSLAGTVWKYSDATTIAIMEFTTPSVFKASMISDDGIWEDEGTYTYNPPTVIMTIDNEPMTATISGNKMTAEDGGRVFTKQ